MGKPSLFFIALVSIHLSTGLSANEASIDNHVLQGRYETSSGGRLNIDQYGRIEDLFVLTVGSSKWLLRYPHRLKSYGISTFFEAEGEVKGSWTSGDCTYPASVRVDATDDFQLLDLTFEVPESFYPDCSYTGNREFMRSYERVENTSE